jgi:flagellar basal body rod protein FlgG
MIPALSSAANGMRSAMARFDRAAQAVTNSTAFDVSSAATDTTDIASDMVDMMTARLAFTASLQMARTSHDMLAEAINLGGYGAWVDGTR